MINRREFTAGAGCALVGSTGSLSPALAQAEKVRVRKKVEIDENGLHIQDWFLESFLEIGSDQADMAAENKHLAVVFEQLGCPYCREMHEVNFAIPEIVNYLKENFGLLQINIWGQRNITDIDGEELPEKNFSRKWGVNFTPTIVFLRQGDLTGVPINLATAARMPGYLKPFHFLSMFEFVAEKKYEEQVFQAFLQDKFDRYKAEGRVPDIW